MHSCMHAWMGRRAIGHTAIGHTAPTPISHIAHPSHTPTWLKSHVHYESFRTHAPRDVPKINTHAVGWTSTHPPTASVIIRCSFFAANPRDVPICRSADLPIARPRTDAWVVVVTRDVRVRGCGCLGRRPRRRVRRPRRRVYDDDGRGITRVATDEVCRDAWTTYTTTTATARSPPSSSFVAHRPSDDVVVEHTHARTHIARTRV